jgi:hypothetical protein
MFMRGLGYASTTIGSGLLPHTLTSALVTIYTDFSFTETAIY